MNILITGGGGYIGTELVKVLSKKHNISVIDKFIFKTELPDNVAIYNKDIREINNVKDYDTVIHLAGLVGTPSCHLDINKTIEINFLASSNIAEICKRDNAKLIFASSSVVYGEQPGEYLDETSRTVPFSLYGLTKLAAENSIMKLADDNFKPILFRKGSLFGLGNRMRFDLFVNLFIAKGILNESITVFGGNQWKPCIHILDVCDAYQKAITSGEYGIFNLGGVNYRIIDIANIIKKEFDININISEKDLYDKRDYKISSDKAGNYLGIKFDRDIKFAINEIKEAFDKNLIKDYNDPKYNNYKWLKEIQLK